jgi:hypothetical protein
MARLFGFDYKSPYFYMVTLKALKGVEAFSQIGPTGLIENEITKAFNTVIRSFHLKWRCLDEISPFVVMPDHIHLLIKIKDVEKRKSLPVLVWQLCRALSAEYSRIAGGRSHLPQNPAPGQVLRLPTAPGRVLRLPAVPAQAGNPFSPDWHDWIVKKSGQLAAFRRYIKENPARAHLRQENKRFFSSVTTVQFCGREWFAYGNTALLDLPVITPFKCSRKLVPDSREWRAFTSAAERIGPGGAGIGTFMSPCEKECGNAIAKAGGSLIILSPDGFSERWHPPRIKERFCAAGRMLFLSLYPAGTRKCDNATLYKRCHEMGDIIVSR